MKRILLVGGVILLALMVSFPAFCGDSQETGYGRGYGYNRGPAGSGWGGGHMMDRGYGMHGGGWGMRGRGHMMGRDWGYGPGDWESMDSKQREEWQKMRSKYRMDTLELRKELVMKQLELETLWDQPDVNQEKVQKLSDEVAELQSELDKKRDKYLLQCRRQFGDRGWACPGGRW